MADERASLRWQIGPLMKPPSQRDRQPPAAGAEALGPEGLGPLAKGVAAPWSGAAGDGVDVDPSVRVLVVEDDDQARAVLAETLHAQGYAVDCTVDVASGLAQLRARRYHLVVTDYWLPDRTGAHLLEEASAQGLLQGTSVLVITAEHRPQGVENLPLLRKPFDLDEFSNAVDGLLASARKESLETVQRSSRGDAADQGAEAGKVELILYTSAASAASFRAVRRLRRVLQHYDCSALSVVVTDVLDDREGAARDRIVFTPTLVKRSPSPPSWIVGDLENVTVLEDLLAFCGVKRTA